MALGRKTGGRQRGAKNRTTLERQRALRDAAQIITRNGHDAFAGDAHTLLISVLQNPSIPLDIRIEAAKAAIAYEKPKLAPIAPPEPPEVLEQKAQRLHALLEEMKKTVGGNGNGHNGHAAIEAAEA